MIVQSIHKAVAAVCPIHGVSIGDQLDKQTWRVDFKDEATPQQRLDARAVIDSIDPSAKSAEELRAESDASELLQAKLDAAIMALVDAAPAQLINYARNNFPTLTLAEQNRMGTVLHILAVSVRPHVR